MSTSNYQHALSPLQCAFKILRTMNENESMCEDSPSFLSGPAMGAGPACPLQDPEIQDGKMIFDRPFLFFTSDEDIYAGPEVRARIVAALLYNMALVYHVTSLSGVSNEEKQLVKARTLYSKAIEVLRLVSPSDAATCMLQMALMNNMTHVFIHFCMYQEARPFAEELWTLIINADPVEEDTTAFYSTLCILQGWSVHAATA
jgi:hypothetical protein